MASSGRRTLWSTEGETCIRFKSLTPLPVALHGSWTRQLTFAKIALQNNWRYVIVPFQSLFRLTMYWFLKVLVCKEFRGCGIGQVWLDIFWRRTDSLSTMLSTEDTLHLRTKHPPCSKGMGTLRSRKAAILKPIPHWTVHEACNWRATWWNQIYWLGPVFLTLFW